MAEGALSPRLAPRRYGLAHRAFFRSIEEGLRLLGGRAVYRRLFLAPGRFRVRHERVAVPALPRGLAGFRIAQLSDLHAGAFVRRGDLAHVVEATNALAPDLVAVTGDLITRRWDEALLLLDDLARLASRHGTLGVFGNHDYHGRMEGRVAEAYAERGIRFLRNACARIDTGEGVLAVVGLEDLEEGKVVDLDAARADVRPGDVELVLCHNPHGAARIARSGCAAILSGHTHGNQIDLPLLRRLGPMHPGDRVDVRGTALVTSRGLGVVGGPVRVRSRPEVVLVELAPAAEPAEEPSGQEPSGQEPSGEEPSGEETAP